MSPETLRWIGVVLATATVLLVILSLGHRWDRIDSETRAKGLVFAYVVSIVDYGFWYALRHTLPLNAAVYLMVPGLLVGVIVYAYYFAKGKK